MVAALDAARGGPVEEGSVGGGTGMNCYDFKGGSGTASRRRRGAHRRRLRPGQLRRPRGADDRRRPRRARAGRRQPDGRLLHAAGQRFDRRRRGHRRAPARAPVQRARPPRDDRRRPYRHGRLALLRRPLPRALDRQPARVPATNAETLHGEAGDGLRTLRFVPWGALDPYFAAVVQATEEAILNALVANAEMTGLNGHRTPALPGIASPRCCAPRYPEIYIVCLCICRGPRRARGHEPPRGARGAVGPPARDVRRDPLEHGRQHGAAVDHRRPRRQPVLLHVGRHLDAAGADRRAPRSGASSPTSSTASCSSRPAWSSSSPARCSPPSRTRRAG